MDIFWNFVKISRDCGAFDEESFIHFKEVYYEDYEDLIQQDPPYHFTKAREAVGRALQKQKEVLRNEGFPKTILDIFDNPDFYVDLFIDVAAFRQYLSYTIQDKLRMSEHRELSDFQLHPKF